ncbi:MAG: hypothetical protein KME49_30080 [Brasilonema octagenarum HA4186-MV1]|nr:hypothetical protein [Brasilonema octagenarum HA4186-MV1]
MGTPYTTYKNEEYHPPPVPSRQMLQRSKLAAWVASPGRLWGNRNARCLCRETLLQHWRTAVAPQRTGSPL